MELVPLNWVEDRISLLYPFLQKGVLVKVHLGSTIHSLLCEQFGLSPDYVNNRIQTAFLNGKPVDDFETAILGEGAVLTLSGAMPGLAGATLRKGGFYSSMRATVTHREGRGGKEKKEGFIKVRIFNLLLNELAPILLEHGIYLEERDLDDLRRSLPSQPPR